jgi:hypothetical protein
MRASGVLTLTSVSRSRVAPKPAFAWVADFRVELQRFDVLDVSVDDSHSGADGMQLRDPLVRATRAVIEIARVGFQSLPQDDRVLAKCRAFVGIRRHTAEATHRAIHQIARKFLRSLLPGSGIRPVKRAAENGGSSDVIPKQPPFVRQLRVLVVGWLIRVRNRTAAGVVKPAAAYPRRIPIGFRQILPRIQAVHVYGQRDLLEVSLALSSHRFVFGFAQRRKQHARQNRDDGNDHQQFYQG